MKKKNVIAVVILVAVLAALLCVVMTNRSVESAVNEPVPTQEPAAVDAQTAPLEEEEVFEVAELYGTVTEASDTHVMLDVPQMGMVQAFITDDTLIEGVEKIEIGQVVKVIYDGKMTRSIPAQVTAMLIGVYVVQGEVKAVEDDSMTILRADTQEEVIISLPEGTEVAAGEQVTVYTTGTMTMSLPPQMNAVAVVK